MSENMARLLKFAIQYRGWHPYGNDSTRSLAKLEERGFIERKECGPGRGRLFRLAPPVSERTY